MTMADRGSFGRAVDLAQMRHAAVALYSTATDGLPASHVEYGVLTEVERARRIL